MARFIRIAFCSAMLMLCATFATANHVDCRRDINNDGFANRDDVKIIDAAMGSRVGAAPYDERADLNQDDRVDEDDREAYKHCAPPPPPAKPTRRAFGAPR